MNNNKNLIFDVGMHKGEDTDYYLKKGYKVVAFEADPDLANYCRKRFEAEIKEEKLIIVEGAIVDFIEGENAPDKVQFYKNTKSSVWGTVVSEWADRNKFLGSDSEIIDVKTVNFIECLRKYGIPYYLKIDIEGMDILCLKALLAFDDRPDYISIESEVVNFDKLLTEFDLFTELGYSSFQAINQANSGRFKDNLKNENGGTLNYKFKSGSTGPFGEALDPEKWINVEKSIQQQKKIFKGYKHFGDASKLNHHFIGKKIIKIMNRFAHYPGWYDTHARHSSVNH